jgi:hypothetical protein
MAYILPSVLVFQEFNLVPAALVDTLRAHISGPHAYLLRYAAPDEKILSYLGAYDPLNDVTSLWPTRPPGAIVDAGYTKVYLDNAKLQYYSHMMGIDTDKVVPTAINKVRSDDPEYGYKANTSTYPRFSKLYDRDVQPGDRVYIRGAAASVNYELDTYVLAIEADTTGTVIQPVQPDTANNGPTQAASSTPVTQTSGTTNSIVMAVSTTGYSALADGAITDTYTVEVTKSSVGGDFTTAEIRVTTSSGNDDDLSVNPLASGDLFAVGTRGLELSFTGTAPDNLLVGQTFEVVVKQKYTAIIATEKGTYTGNASTTYKVEITKGGHFGATDPALMPQFSARTTSNTDSSQPVSIAAAGTDYPVGTQGVKINFATSPDGIRKGDRFYIAVTGQQDGRMSTIVLGHNLPTELLTPTPATDLDLIFYVDRNVMVGEMTNDVPNWEQNETQIILHGNIQAYDEAFTSGGEPRPLPVTAGSVYVEYRAWQSVLASSVGTISDVGTIDDAISGPLTPDNPLKWGVYKALANANGSEVKFTAVANPASVDSWTQVLALLVGRDDVYNLVPLTFDRTVLDLYSAHVNDESAPEQARWRAVFCAIKALSQQAVVSATTSADTQVVMAIISDDPTAVGNQYTLLTVPAGNSDFITNQVRPGDIVRANYGTNNGVETFDEYIIDEVINEDSLRLMSGPDAPISVPEMIEVWRFLSKDEIAADLAKQAGSFSSRRVKAVWPDTVGSAGVLQEGYYLAAALAGLRSGVVPHQGLTNVQVMGFDDLSRTTDFLGGAQLNTMAGAGTWIVTQAPDGTVYNRHALTTDNTDVNSSEEMITSNLDSISYTFSNRLAPYIGRMNVTPSALLILGTEIDATIDFLKSNGYVARLGGQLVDGTILSLQPHAILADRVVAVIDVTLPYPLNNLELHLVV